MGKAITRAKMIAAKDNAAEQAVEVVQKPDTFAVKTGGTDNA